MASDEIEVEWNKEKVRVINNEYSDFKTFGLGYGYEFIELSKDILNSLISGKVIAWNDGEYSHFIKLGK
jgi:hypothetical protein